MNKLIQWAAAAAISAGGLTYVSTTHADDTISDKASRAVDSTKEKARDMKANWENGRVYTLLGQVTNAALTKGGLNDLTARFNDADRTRVNLWVKDKNNKEKLDVLDGRIAQFQKDWKAKYGNDFKIHKDDVVFGNAMFTVAQGEIGKDAVLAGEKLPVADPSHPVTGGDKNLENGRNVAYVTVAASHGLPELKVPLIHEMPDMWKIDVPDNVDGKKLYDNVLNHLTIADDMKDKWPVDETEAYRAVTHHILAAILDVSENADGAAAHHGGDTAQPIGK